MFFTIPILITAAFFGRRATYAVGLAVAGVYALLSLLDYTRVLPVLHIVAPRLHTDPTIVFPTLVGMITIFVVITAITVLVGRLIREREQLSSEVRALSAHNAEIDAILRTMGSALVSVDREGTITTVNDSFEMLTAWKRVDAIGKPLEEVMPILDVHGQTVEAVYRPTLAFITDNKSVHDLKSRPLSGYSYVRKDGPAFHFVGNVAPIVSHGMVIGFTIVFNDATELIKLDQLKDNFIALISHQLKTPIGEINGYAYNLLGGVAGALNPQLTTYAEAIQEQAARAGKLIADLLDIVVAGEGNLTVHNEPVDVGPVIDQVLKLRQPQAAKKHLKLVVERPDGLLYVRGDEHKLVQAIGNLVDNAIRYTKTGSVAMTVVPAGDMVEIRVSDKGRGMDPATLDALFGQNKQLGPLVRASTAEGGSGLGVYLAKQLVALMSGTIRVVSSTKHGTTIAVTLHRVSPERDTNNALQSKHMLMKGDI